MSLTLNAAADKKDLQQEIAPGETSSKQKAHAGGKLEASAIKHAVNIVLVSS